MNPEQILNAPVVTNPDGTKQPTVPITADIVNAAIQSLSTQIDTETQVVTKISANIAMWNQQLSQLQGILADMTPSTDSSGS